MTTSKITIYFTIIFLVLLVGVPTFYKVIKNNHEKLYLVTEKLIVENAKRCIYEGKCESEKVTLNELYKNNYIEKTVIDPVSKIVYTKDSYVLFTKDGSTFYPLY